MIMKTISKLLSVLIVYGVADNANAQKRDAGEWSIIPKVGVKLAKLKGDKIVRCTMTLRLWRSWTKILNITE